MTHETLTSCFIHVLTPPVPVVHASPSMFKCLVISPFVLLYPFLAVFKLFFLFQCVSLSVFVCVTSAQGRRRTHHSLRAGKSSTSDLSYWNSDLWVSFRGALKGLVWCLFFLPVPFCLCLLCLFAWWRIVGVALPAAPVLMALFGREVRSWSSSFFRVLCLSGWITSQSFWPCCCPATGLHGCMHVAPLIGARLVSLLCLSIETESTQLRRRKNSVKMWKRAFPYLKCPGITLAAENLCQRARGLLSNVWH